MSTNEISSYYLSLDQRQSYLYWSSVERWKAVNGSPNIITNGFYKMEDILFDDVLQNYFRVQIMKALDVFISSDRIMILVRWCLLISRLIAYIRWSDPGLAQVKQDGSIEVLTYLARFFAATMPALPTA